MRNLRGNRYRRRLRYRPRDCAVGVGSLAVAGMDVPDRPLVLGRPTAIVRPLTQEEIGGSRENMQDYLRLAASDQRGVMPV